MVLGPFHFLSKCTSLDDVNNSCGFNYPLYMLIIIKVVFETWISSQDLQKILTQYSI